MYKAIELFIEVLAYVVDGYCLYMLFGELGEPRIKRRWLPGILIISAWFAANQAIRYAVFSDSFYTLEKSLFSFVLHAGVIYVIGLCFYKSSRAVRIFLTLLFLALLYALSEIGYSVRMFLVEGIERLTWHIEILQSVTIARFLVDSVYVFMDVAAVLLFYISIKIIGKNLRHSIVERNTKEFVSDVLPALLGSLVSVALYFILLMINEQGHIMEYENYRAVHLFIIIVFGSVWLIILYGFRLREEMMELQEERTQKRILENQVLEMQNSMLEMERFYENVSHVKHDMKNQMAVMEKMLGEYKITGNGEIAQFFEDMQKTLMHLEKKIHTGNVVSDAVISSKFYYAAKEIEGIQLDADEFLLTDQVHVRAYDIGIILNNGLDNAIEACRKAEGKKTEEKLYIKLRSFRKQNMFFIEMENSFDGEIKWGEDGLPCSTKEEEGDHGIGLKNIRYCARKYGGDMDCIAEGGRFTLSVMLKA